MSDFVVPLHKFRQALQATKVHADPKSEIGLDTVRLLPGDTLHVMATDRVTAALAAVPAEILDPDVSTIDLALDDVDKILAVFKMPSEKALWSSAAVGVRCAGNEATFVDTGGLFEGQSLTVPAYSNDPGDVAEIIAARVRADTYLGGADYGIGPRHLVKLGVAAKAYGYPAYVQLRGREKPYWLALVGPDFAAVVMPRLGADEDREDRPEDWRDAWRRALPTGDRLGDVVRGMAAQGITVTVSRGGGDDD